MKIPPRFTQSLTPVNKPSDNNNTPKLITLQPSGISSGKGHEVGHPN